MTVWFATGNVHKKNELAEILFSDIRSAGFAVKIPADAGLDFAPDETGNTFLDNALIKAEALHKLLGGKSISSNNSGNNASRHWQPGDPVIADDSGICVDALNGRPGIYSARYGSPDTTHKLSDKERNALLLAELGDNPLRSARFVCAMVLYYSPNRFFVAQESMEGTLVQDLEAACGGGGFGYDPILFLPEMGRTVAELTAEEKNRLSHRGKAGKAIASILFSNILFGKGQAKN